MELNIEIGPTLDKLIRDLAAPLAAAAPQPQPQPAPEPAAPVPPAPPAGV